MILSYDTAQAFAVKRNPKLSFPFLKENGELLRIVVDSGFLIDSRAINLYSDFYKSALQLTRHYPQYFRFIFGIVIDLEKGGMPGNESEKIAKYILDKELVLFDMCSTRKLETLTMLQEVISLGRPLSEIRKSIIEDVDRILSNPDLYAKFNKPLFYEITHIIFFLTGYGKTLLPLQNDVEACLINMGLLCLLDNDADLLAEICICLIYIGAEIPSYWDSFLQKSFEQVNISYHETVSSALNAAVDEYHVYFVLNWYQAVNNRPSFQTNFKGRTPSFSLPPMRQSILSKLSDFSHQKHFNGNSADWDLDEFILSLDVDERQHWEETVNTVPTSSNLIRKFAGI